MSWNVPFMNNIFHNNTVTSTTTSGDFVHVTGDSSVTINGKTYTGRDIYVSNGKAIVDGKKETYTDDNNRHSYTVEIKGNPSKVETAGPVTVTGDCGSINTAGNVTVNGSSGSINTMGSVTVKGNSGNISTMGQVSVGGTARTM